MQIQNTANAIRSYFTGKDTTARVLMESTGKYHRLVHRLLSGMGFAVMVINPYQSRYFAKALNVLCKTDKVDARLLALYAEQMPFTSTVCATVTEEQLQDLSRHLDDLKQTAGDFERRRKESKGFIGRSLDSTIKSLEREINRTEKELKEKIHRNSELHAKLKLMTSIPGVGETTAISLLSYVKALGRVGKREVAALTGLAPVNNESGTFSGKRHIRGGRHDVRSHLYMPIIGAATQHNERLKCFYHRLRAQGKPAKVALTACMRKLVVWINAIIASGQPWSEQHA